MNPRDIIWTEKYRPKKIDEMVGSFKDKIKTSLEKPNMMQHLLLHSLVPGTGKTSLAKVIINELGADSLILNSSDDRKIETVRSKITSFVQTKSSQIGKRRIVFLDEADGLTNDAQNALRNVMETYADNALFILTCNRITAVSDAIRSRCEVIEFSLPDKMEILTFLKKICDNENLKYTDTGLNNIIEDNYPSIRNCVKILQTLKSEGKEVTDEPIKVTNDEYKDLWEKVTVEKNWNYVKEYVFLNDIDVKALNQYFWYKSVEQSNVRMIQITASNEDKFNRGGEPVIIFITSLIDMVK